MSATLPITHPRKETQINTRFPRWTQTHDDGTEYTIIVVPNEWASHWAAALTFAEYEGREWIVRRGHWLVGCPLGLGYRAPQFEDVCIPSWTANVEETAPWVHRELATADS